MWMTQLNVPFLTQPLDVSQVLEYVSFRQQLFGSSRCSKQMGVHAEGRRDRKFFFLMQSHNTRLNLSN